jgi:hypothetical protein
VNNNGGLATAKRMLHPWNQAQRQGLDRMLNAGRPDLTLEVIILRKEFRPLFATNELKVAKERLQSYGIEADRRLHPDGLNHEETYPEGSKRHVLVNQCERNPPAREKRIKHHGPRCAVCDLSFAERYGKLGLGFIHVHHLKPLAIRKAAYFLNALIYALLAGSADLIDKHFGFTPADPRVVTLFTGAVHSCRISSPSWKYVVLWIFGRPVEDALGSIVFLFVYAICCRCMDSRAVRVGRHHTGNSASGIAFWAHFGGFYEGLMVTTTSTDRTSGTAG